MINGQAVATLCSRCRRSRYDEAGSDADRWNDDYRAGYAVGLICPGCQTGTESLGAEIDAIELEQSELVESASLDRQGQAEAIVHAIYTRALSVVARHRDLAVMAGETQVAVDVKAWAREAVDEWPGSRGQSQAALDGAYQIAEEVIQDVIDENRAGQS